MINLLWSGFVMVLLLSGCGWDGTASRHNDFVPLTSIEIVADSPTIAVNTSTRLKVTGNYSGMFTRDITDQAVWSSDTPAVAAFVTAANPGRVTGQSPGSAILAAAVGNVTATFKLTVSSATPVTLTLSPAAPTVARGLTTQFKVTGTFSDSTTQDLTFDAVWSSSDATVATVSDATGSKGLAQAIAAGSTTINATFGTISGTTLLTVTAPALQSITVSPDTPSVLSLSTATFKAIGRYSDGTTPDITNLVTWASSNTAIAAAPIAGVTTTFAQGATSISATLSGVSGSTTLKVTGGNLASFTLSTTGMTLVRGTTGTISATGAFSNGSSRDISGGVTWSIANTNLATVTTSGNRVLVNAKATGITTLKATSGSLNTTINLAVTAPSLRSFTISPASLTLTAGTSDRLTVNAIFNDNTSQDITADATWSSSAPAIALAGTAGPDGERINGVASGSATITATYGGQSLTIPVTVRTRNLQNISLTPGVTSSVAIGNQVTFTLTATYSDGTTKDVTGDAAWTIDDPDVAILADSQNQPGQVVAVNSGSTTLNASFGGKSQSVTVRVP